MLSEEGSCGFYECFEDRFPCDRAVSDSHQIQFELTHCLTMEAVAKQLNTPQVLPHSTKIKRQIYIVEISVVLINFAHYFRYLTFPKDIKNALHVLCLQNTPKIT